MRKFKFGKSYEEVEIAGETYEIRFDDEKIYEYHEAFEDFVKKSNEIEKLNHEEVSTEEVKEAHKDTLEMIEEVLDIILGEGAYEVLYEQSGKSTIEMIELMGFISDVVGESIESIREDRKNKYVKK